MIQDVRAVRKALADDYGDDVDRLCEHLKSLDEQYHSRIRRPAARAEAVVESVHRHHATIFETCTQSVRELLEWDADPRGPRAERRMRFDALVGYFRDDAAWRRAASHGSLPTEVMGYPIEAVRQHVLKLSQAREIARQIARIVSQLQALAGRAIEAEAAEFVRRDLRTLREAAVHVRDACPLQGVPIIDPTVWKQHYADPLARGIELLSAVAPH